MRVNFRPGEKKDESKEIEDSDSFPFSLFFLSHSSVEYCGFYFTVLNSNWRCSS